MALRGEIVDFVGAYLADHLHDRHRVAEVGVMEVEIGVAFEMGYTFAEIHGGATDRAVHVVTFFKEQFGKKRAVLTRYAW